MWSSWTVFKLTPTLLTPLPKLPCFVILTLLLNCWPHLGCHCSVKCSVSICSSVIHTHTCTCTHACMHMLAHTLTHVYVLSLSLFLDLYMYCSLYLIFCSELQTCYHQSPHMNTYMCAYDTCARTHTHTQTHTHSLSLTIYIYIYISPWYNRTGWLGIKHQSTYLLSLSLSFCFSLWCSDYLFFSSKHQSIITASGYKPSWPVIHIWLWIYNV